MSVFTPRQARASRQEDYSTIATGMTKVGGGMMKLLLLLEKVAAEQPFSMFRSRRQNRLGATGCTTLCVVRLDRLGTAKMPRLAANPRGQIMGRRDWWIDEPSPVGSAAQRHRLGSELATFTKPETCWPRYDRDASNQRRHTERR